tara:strand:+ start:1760 stop:2116 length:357 start_codon:yes stop_codon:yes gene_type:complete
MTNPIFANEIHKATIEVYIDMCKQFTKEVSSETKYKNYLDVVKTVIDYHNGYGNGIKQNNFNDWLMIIPINLTVATNGFFAALESKKNSSSIRSYKVILEQLLQETVDKLNLLELENE